MRGGQPFLSGPAVWAELTRAARGGRRADVAVAFFGQGSAKRLPLAPGSRLVVDASERTVGVGATCPAELLKMVESGVEVFSRDALHAKVYVFGRVAYVGSANASSSSAERLVEAMIRTTDAAAVRAAREFVVSMADGIPLGPEMLRKLQTLYRPPRLPGGGGRSAKRRRTPKVWFETFEADDYPEGTEDFANEVMSEAREKRRHGRGHELIEIWRSGPPRYAENDTVIMLNPERGGLFMDPPGRVIHVRRKPGASGVTFSVLEVPQRRRVALPRVAKQLGHGWLKRLSRRGRLPHAIAMPLIAYWNKGS